MKQYIKSNRQWKHKVKLKILNTIGGMKRRNIDNDLDIKSISPKRKEKKSARQFTYAQLNFCF